MPEVFNASHQKAHTTQDLHQSSEQADPTVAEHDRSDDTERNSHILDKAKAAVEGFKEKTQHLHRDPLAFVDEYSSVMKSATRSSSPLDAFAAKPLHIYGFDSQLENEKVLLLLRQHPITQVGKLITAVILILLPFLLSTFDFFAVLPGRFQVAAMLFWYLIVAGFVIESFLTWFYNVYIVTDERIIDVDFLSLIYKNISAAKIDNIEDITSTSGGALRALFDFGTVKIQTAAATAELEFEEVPHPTKVTQFLNEMLLQEEQERIEGRVR